LGGGTKVLGGGVGQKVWDGQRKVTDGQQGRKESGGKGTKDVEGGESNAAGPGKGELPQKKAVK